MKLFIYNRRRARRLQTMNECPRERLHPRMAPAHINGEPDVPVHTTEISIRFADSLPVEIPLRHVKGMSEPETAKEPVPPLPAARVILATAVDP
jgi:hypothetical protein